MNTLNEKVSEQLDKAHGIMNAFIPFAETIAFRMYRNVRCLNPEAFDRDITSVLALARLYNKRHHYDKANELYSMAIEKTDNATAHRKLGDAYFCGRGCQINYAIAFSHYQAAAMKNDEQSFEKLGHCFDFAMGCPQSYSSAHCWYSSAACISNDKKAIKRLGDFALYGLDGEPDEYKAIQWYRKGAALNHRESLIALADCYRHGIGVDGKQFFRALYYRIKAGMVEVD